MLCQHSAGAIAATLPAQLEKRLGCLSSVAGNQGVEDPDVIFSASLEVLKTVSATQNKTVVTPVSLDLEFKTSA